MAQVTLSGFLKFYGLNVGNLTFDLGTITQTLTGVNFIEGTQLIPTTTGGTAISLGGLTNCGFFAIKNTDQTNYVQLLNAANGTVLQIIKPNLFTIGCFDTSVTAPALLANTASCLVKYFISEH